MKILRGRFSPRLVNSAIMEMLKEMSTWVIISWIVVAILIAINVFVFLKLKNASQQMLKMAFPGAKNMSEAMSQMQDMMSMAGHAKGKGKGKRGFHGPRPKANPQLQHAMSMLQQLQQKKK